MIQISSTQTEIINTIVNSIGDALVACDNDGKFILYNSGAEKILGPSMADGKPEKWTSHFGSFLPDKITPFPLEQYPLLRGLKGEETNDVEQFVRNAYRPEGVYISISGRPIRDSKKQILGSVVVVRDISKRKAAEEEIKSTNIALVAINKELESFSYAVSHDLRAPLRSIIGFSDMLIRKHSKELSAEALDLQTRVKDSGVKLGQLIDGLLDLSRLTRGDLKRERINLSEIARGILDDLKMAEPNRKVTFEVSNNIFADADGRLLRSVLLNLISNAWKFSAKKSESKIEFGVCPSNSGDGLVYFVKDNGVGYNEKYSSKLFSIFQRLHSLQDFEGNGIGLATVQRIISRHGGKVWAESKLGEGATFYFTL